MIKKIIVSGEGKDLHLEQILDSAPAVNPDDIIWIANAMLNKATLTVVPYLYLTFEKGPRNSN